MKLLVDIGNSRLKWAVAERDDLRVGAAVGNHALSSAALDELWRGLPRPEQLAIACVSAHRFADIARGSAEALWPGIPIVQAQSTAQACGVANAYPQPEKLGVDRWLALLAAYRDYPAPLCIVDCGTAITVDLLDAQGRHLGGMICPGLELMKTALSAGTEALAYDAATFSVGPARTTAAGIHSGVLSAAAGLIEHVMSEQPPNCKLLLTGGDARPIAEQLDYNYRIDADLVLRGLSLLTA